MKKKEKFYLIDVDFESGCWKFLGFIGDHPKLMYIIFLLIEVLLEWQIVKNSIDIFGIISMLISPALMLVAVAAITLIVSFAEVSAEMIADCIAPRPGGLPCGPDWTTTTFPQTSQKTSSASMSAQAQNSDESTHSFRDDVMIETYKMDREVESKCGEPEFGFCLGIGPVVDTYYFNQKDRGVTVSDFEICWLWYSLADVVGYLLPKEPKRENAYRKNVIKELFVKWPEAVRNRSYSECKEEYDEFTEYTLAVLAERDKDVAREKITRGWIIKRYVELFLENCERMNDEVTEEILYSCFESAFTNTVAWMEEVNYDDDAGKQ